MKIELLEIEAKKGGRGGGRRERDGEGEIGKE